MDTRIRNRRLLFLFVQVLNVAIPFGDLPDRVTNDEWYKILSEVGRRAIFYILFLVMIDSNFFGRIIWGLPCRNIYRLIFIAWFNGCGIRYANLNRCCLYSNNNYDKNQWSWFVYLRSAELDLILLFTEWWKSTLYIIVIIYYYKLFYC